MSWNKNIEQAENLLANAQDNMSPRDPQLLVLASIASSLIDIAKSLDTIMRQGNGRP